MMEARAIAEQLTENGLFIGRPWDKDLVSAKLSEDKDWREDTLQKLLDYAVHHTNVEDPPSFVGSKLVKDEWVHIIEDLGRQKRSARRMKGRASRVIESNEPRSRRWATRENPAGWPAGTERQEARRQMLQDDLDHDRPGEWNAYRCAYNHPGPPKAEGYAFPHRYDGRNRVVTCTVIDHEGEEL